MSPEEIFDNSTKSYGGRLLKRNNQINSTKTAFDSLLNHYSNDPRLLKKFPNIIVDFVQNSTLNAFAKKYPKYYVIRN